MILLPKAAPSSSGSNHGARHSGANFHNTKTRTLRQNSEENEILEGQIGNERVGLGGSEGDIIIAPPQAAASRCVVDGTLVRDGYCTAGQTTSLLLRAFDAKGKILHVHPALWRCEATLVPLMHAIDIGRQPRPTNKEIQQVRNSGVVLKAHLQALQTGEIVARMKPTSSCRMVVHAWIRASSSSSNWVKLPGTPLLGIVSRPSDPSPLFIDWFVVQQPTSAVAVGTSVTVRVGGLIKDVFGNPVSPSTFLQENKDRKEQKDSWFPTLKACCDALNFNSNGTTVLGQHKFGATIVCSEEEESNSLTMPEICLASSYRVVTRRHGGAMSAALEDSTQVGNADRFSHTAQDDEKSDKKPLDMEGKTTGEDSDDDWKRVSEAENGRSRRTNEKLSLISSGQENGSSRPVGSANTIASASTFNEDILGVRFSASVPITLAEGSANTSGRAVSASRSKGRIKKTKKQSQPSSALSTEEGDIDLVKSMLSGDSVHQMTSNLSMVTTGLHGTSTDRSGLEERDDSDDDSWLLTDRQGNDNLHHHTVDDASDGDFDISVPAIDAKMKNFLKETLQDDDEPEDNLGLEIDVAQDEATLSTFQNALNVSASGRQGRPISAPMPRSSSFNSLNSHGDNTHTSVNSSGLARSVSATSRAENVSANVSGVNGRSAVNSKMTESLHEEFGIGDQCLFASPIILVDVKLDVDRAGRLELFSASQERPSQPLHCSIICKSKAKQSESAVLSSGGAVSLIGARTAMCTEARGQGWVLCNQVVDEDGIMSAAASNCDSFLWEFVASVDNAWGKDFQSISDPLVMSSLGGIGFWLGVVPSRSTSARLLQAGDPAAFQSQNFQGWGVDLLTGHGMRDGNWLPVFAQFDSKEVRAGLNSNEDFPNPGPPAAPSIPQFNDGDKFSIIITIEDAAISSLCILHNGRPTIPPMSLHSDEEDFATMMLRKGAVATAVLGVHGLQLTLSKASYM